MGWNLGKNRKLGILVLVLAGMFLAGTGEAALHVVDKYLVNVDARTSLHYLIPHATVKCRLSGDRITISAYAPGYQPREHKLTVRPNVLTYAVDLILPDPPKRLDVLTFQHKPIASAFFDRFQGGTPPDQYAINLFLPVQSWPHPSPANVYVNQPGYGIPIQNTCDISKHEEFYKVRMLIDRAVLDDPHDELLVYVNTSTTLDAISAARWYAEIRRLERDFPPAAADLARVVFEVLPGDAATESLPGSLARLAALRTRFLQLHRER